MTLSTVLTIQCKLSSDHFNANEFYSNPFIVFQRLKIPFKDDNALAISALHIDNSRVFNNHFYFLILLFFSYYSTFCESCLVNNDFSLFATFMPHESFPFRLWIRHNKSWIQDSLQQWWQHVLITNIVSFSAISVTTACLNFSWCVFSFTTLVTTACRSDQFRCNDGLCIFAHQVWLRISSTICLCFIVLSYRWNWMILW